MPLAGSPSAPLATTTGDRPAATDRHLVPTGNQAPPWPRSPDWSTDSSSVRAGTSGSAPQRARWASRRDDVGAADAVEQPGRPGRRRHRRDPARPVTLPESAPVCWPTWSWMVRVIGDGVATVATTVPPFRPTTVPVVPPKVDGAGRERHAAARLGAHQHHGQRRRGGIGQVHGQGDPDVALGVGGRLALCPAHLAGEGHRRGRNRCRSPVPWTAASRRPVPWCPSPPRRSWRPAGRAATGRSRSGGTSRDAAGRGAAKPAMTRVTTMRRGRPRPCAGRGGASVPWSSARRRRRARPPCRPPRRTG